MELPDAPRELDPRTLPVGRAAFLGTVAAGVGAIALASRFHGSVPNVADVARAIPGPVGQLAPSKGWRIYTVQAGLPRFDPATYELRVSGLVARPRTFTWAELSTLGGVDQVSDFHCVTGWTVRKVRWEGIRPATLLDLVHPLPQARYVELHSLEHPYVDGLTLGQLQRADVLFARGMDGTPLTRPHGAPLRLVIPDMYGYKNVKWVRELRFLDAPRPGFWEVRGYDVDAWVGRSNGYA